MTYNLDSIGLIPAIYTEIESRSECNPCYENNKLPIWIAPMSSLIDCSNVDLFNDYGFNAIIPRTVNYDTRIEMLNKGYVVAFGLEEASKLTNLDGKRICIDQANGHMKKLMMTCKELKDKYKVWIMTGNIANPQTYINYAKAGIDAVRIGIGAGNVCTTSLQTGIHYPMATLISKMVSYKSLYEDQIKKWPLIIADGGFTNISQIIKALALGADYVMIGRMAAEMEEACGKKTAHNERLYYGMSTFTAQTEINSAKLGKYSKMKHSEGAIKTVKITTNLGDFVDDFKHALRSSMSYTNARTLQDFVGKIEWKVMESGTLNKKV